MASFLPLQLPEQLTAQLAPLVAAAAPYTAAVAEHWARFEEVVQPWERTVALAAHPGFPYDSRPTAGWPMTRLSQALALCGGYLVLVLLGIVRRATTTPAKEAKSVGVLEGIRREPIKLLQIVYNAVQVVLCTWMMAAAFMEARSQNFSLFCNKFDAMDTRLATVEWVFYLSKVLDFFDTFFIVVRGKWDQFSFLHCYHHVSIFMIYWLVTVAAYDGDVYYTIIANSLVHAVMYLYYFLTCFNIRPSWGKNLTQLQMLQFITMNAQAIYILVNGCPYPAPLTAFYLVYIISLFTLFANFYAKRWSAPKAKKAKTL